MTSSLLTWMRQAHLFSRGTAGLVLVTFSMMVLQPTVAAAQIATTAPSTVQPDDSAEAHLSRTLVRIEETLTHVVEKLEAGENADIERGELNRLKAVLRQLDAPVRTQFAAVEQHLHDHALPQEILDRHQAMVDYYTQELNDLLRELEALEAAADNPGRLHHAKAAKDRLKTQQNQRRQQPFDPNHLPLQVPESKVRAPKDNQEELEDLMAQNEPVQIAALELSNGMLASSTVSVTPIPADLAETEDVQISNEIKAMAQSLDNNPVEIYQWVRNHIEFIPTYGSIQGSQLTLANQRGNAFDTSSLLIALYRAAGIPARYAYGTVQLPIEQVMNWVGGVESPMAALDLLDQGGIPCIAVSQGGVIQYIKLEHVWVEAYVDYIPSRGAKHFTGDSWVPMDASFKQYQYGQGMDLKNAVPFDDQGLLEQIQQGATVNEADGSIQNIDQNLVKTTLIDYQDRIRTYVDSQKANPTVGDLIGFKTIVEQKLPILASGLPYKVLVSGVRTAALSDSLRHKIRLFLYGSLQDRSLDSPVMSFTASLPSLAGKRLAFTYEPATSDDQAVIDSAINSYQTQLPAYLIRVKPTLTLDGQIVATGGAYTMGVKQVLSVAAVAPWYQHNRDYQVTSGDFHVLGLNPAGITASAFTARSHQYDLKNMKESDVHDYTAEMFHQIALAWWGEKEVFNDFIGAINRVVHYQLPSHTLAGTPLTVRYFFGIARSASYGSRVMDAQEDFITSVHAGGYSEERRHFVRAAGYMGSYLEAGIYDQAFLMDPGHSMSTITALKAASEKGVAIYSIDSANAAALNQIVTDPDDLQTMRNAVAAGLRVTTAQRDMTVDNFTGLGYILEDPKTGAAAYLISGGRNGANSPAGQSVYALPQFPAYPIIGMMLRSSLRSAGASLVAEGGVVIGIALPELAAAGVTGAAVGAAATASAILMAIIVTLIILTAVIQAVDENYPRINRRYRHYSPVATAIAATKILFASPSGTFGSGVYLADALDEEKKGMGCPPDLLSVATRFQLFGSDGVTVEPKRAAGWIEITITRDNYYVIEPKINSYGQTEYLLKAPLHPSIHWRTKSLEPALWIGEYQFGMEFNYLSDVCASLNLLLLP